MRSNNYNTLQSCSVSSDQTDDLNATKKKDMYPGCHTCMLKLCTFKSCKKGSSFKALSDRVKNKIIINVLFSIKYWFLYN